MASLVSCCQGPQSLPVSWHNLVSEASAKTNSADETSGSDKSQETKENQGPLAARDLDLAAIVP